MSQVVDTLIENDINADDYVRGPLGKNVFCISVRPITKEGQIKVWPGLANIDVFPEKKYRQAVLYVDETNRVVERTIKTWASEGRARDDALRSFRRSINLPQGAKFKTEPATLIRTNPHRKSGNWGQYSVKVSATLPDTKQTLLLGMDETYHFIAALPEHVKSVEEAHDILRPKELKDGSYRQGEWFFVPLDDKTLNKLDRIAAQNPSAVARRSFNKTSHYGMQVIERDGKTYACGYVFDGRGSTHHEGLFLPDWYEVVKNKEANVNQESLARVARRYWD